MPTPTLPHRHAILAIVRRVRKILMPHYGTVSFKEKDSGRTHDFVTDLDFAIEKFLKEELGRLFPNSAFVGEETGGNRSAERFWLVDPIDGTDHFIRGLPFCTTMLALVEYGMTTFSAIYDFVNDVMYTAEKGGGAFANGKPIHVNMRPFTSSRITWDFRLDTPEHIQKFLWLSERCIPFDTGASGFAFSMVACGKLDGRICIDGGKDYDYAPGALLVSEAGGTVANIGKTTYDYKNLSLIATNPLIFKELTEGPEALFPIVSNQQ